MLGVIPYWGNFIMTCTCASTEVIRTSRLMSHSSTSELGSIQKWHKHQEYSNKDIDIQMWKGTRGSYTTHRSATFGSRGTFFLIYCWSLQGDPIGTVSDGGGIICLHRFRAIVIYLVGLYTCLINTILIRLCSSSTRFRIQWGKSASTHRLPGRYHWTICHVAQLDRGKDGILG